MTEPTETELTRTELTETGPAGTELAEPAAADLAAVPGLTRSDPRAPGITRERGPDGFRYLDPSGAPVTDPATLLLSNRPKLNGPARFSVPVPLIVPRT